MHCQRRLSLNVPSIQGFNGWSRWSSLGFCYLWADLSMRKTAEDSKQPYLSKFFEENYMKRIFFFDLPPTFTLVLLVIKDNEVKNLNPVSGLWVSNLWSGIFYFSPQTSNLASKYQVFEHTEQPLFLTLFTVSISPSTLCQDKDRSKLS